MSCETKKTLGVQKKQKIGGNHVLCLTVYKIWEIWEKWDKRCWRSGSCERCSRCERLNLEMLSHLKSNSTNLSWRQFTDTSALFLFNCQSKTRPRSRDCRNSISFVVSDVRGVTVWMFLCWPGPITPSAISGSRIELKWQLIPDLEIPYSSDLVILSLNLCNHRYGSCSWRTGHYLL